MKLNHFQLIQTPNLPFSGINTRNGEINVLKRDVYYMIKIGWKDNNSSYSSIINMSCKVGFEWDGRSGPAVLNKFLPQWDWLDDEKRCNKTLLIQDIWFIHDTLSLSGLPLELVQFCFAKLLDLYGFKKMAQALIVAVTTSCSELWHDVLDHYFLRNRPLLCMTIVTRKEG